MLNVTKAWQKSRERPFPHFHFLFIFGKYCIGEINQTINPAARLGLKEDTGNQDITGVLDLDRVTAPGDETRLSRGMSRRGHLTATEVRLQNKFSKRHSSSYTF